jgi:hypothetical protein
VGGKKEEQENYSTRDPHHRDHVFQRQELPPIQRRQVFLLAIKQKGQSDEFLKQ